MSDTVAFTVKGTPVYKTEFVTRSDTKSWAGLMTVTMNKPNDRPAAGDSATATIVLPPKLFMLIVNVLTFSAPELSTGIVYTFVILEESPIVVPDGNSSVTFMLLTEVVPLFFTRTSTVKRPLTSTYCY